MDSSLKNMLLPEKTVTIDFPGLEGLTFSLSYLSKDSNQKLLKRCQKTKYDSRTRQPMEELNEEMFLSEYTKAVVKGWEGFKFKYLLEFGVFDISAYDPDDFIVYSEENALLLLQNSNVFDSWLSEVLSELTNFTKTNTKEKQKESKATSKKVVAD